MTTVCKNSLLDLMALQPQEILSTRSCSNSVQFLIVSQEMLGIASKERKAKMVLRLQSLQVMLGPFGFVGVLDMDV